MSIIDALRFADLLSKSNDTINAVQHKMWAQEIVGLLYGLYPENKDVVFYAGAILHNIGNYQGQELVGSTYSGIDAYDRIYSYYKKKWLSVPADQQKTFFFSQRQVYEHLEDAYFCARS